MDQSNFWGKANKIAETSFHMWKWRHETQKCLVILDSTVNEGNQKCTENSPKEPEVNITIRKLGKINLLKSTGYVMHQPFKAYWLRDAPTV